MNEPAALREIRPELFAEYIDWLDRPEKTARTYITNLRSFAAWLAYTGTRQPQRKDVILYRQWLQSEHEAISWDGSNAAGWRYRTDRNGERIRVTCSAATVSEYLQSVRQFFAWTAAAGLYPSVAEGVRGPKIRQDTHRKDALTAGELLEVEQGIIRSGREAIAAAEAADKDRAGRVQRAEEQSKRLLAMFLLAANAGMRTIELSRANVKDFVTRGGQSWIYIFGKGRTGADEKTALACEVAAAVTDYLGSRHDAYSGSSPLFVSTGNRSGGQRIAPTTISTMFKRALKEAGFDDERLTAHSFRHSCGTGAMTVTRDLYAVQRFMRHTDPRTTEIYLHTQEEQQDAETARLLYDWYHKEADNEGTENTEDHSNR